MNAPYSPKKANNYRLINWQDYCRFLQWEGAPGMDDTKGRVLVIDDEAGYLALLKIALEENHFEGLTASSAVEALKIALEEVPDLILLDLVMPDMSGIGLLRQLKRIPKLSLIPVIVLTGLIDECVEKEVEELGAEGLVPKDWGVDQVMSLVATRLA